MLCISIQNWITLIIQKRMNVTVVIIIQNWMTLIIQKRMNVTVVIIIQNWIGGEDEHHQDLDIVEVYDGRQWAKTDPLPISCYYVKVAFHNDRYYLVGGTSQDESVFSTSPQAIVSQSPRSEPVWKTHLDAPLALSGVVMFESELVTVGGLESTSLHMYSPVTDTWKVMESRLPEVLHSMCSITLPTGEMMVIGGESSNDDWSPLVYQASVKN